MMGATPSNGRRLAVALSTIGLLAAGMPHAIGALEPAPSVRLILASPRVDLQRFGTRVPLDLGVWVAAAGGDFEIHAGRSDYDSPIRASQVDAVTGDVLRDLPAADVDGWEGLDGFLRVTFYKPSGERVATKKLTFCPNSYDRERVDDSGPDRPGYPTMECGSYFPFTKGTVWGIDEGWATTAVSTNYGSYDYGVPTVGVPTGDYSVTVHIPPHYTDLFEIAPGNERVTLDVTVTKGRRGECCFGRRAGRERGEASTTDVPTVTEPDPSTLPDLAALPAWAIRVRNGERADRLSFAATPWNAGPSPLDVEGFRRAGEDVMDAYQYFYDSDGNVTGRAPVGRMEFDTRRGHHHWHFLQFVRYRLLRASDRTAVVRSHKQSFCIAPTDPVDLMVEGAVWDPYRIGLSSACGGATSIWVREVLQSGWGDTYFQSVAGQAFDITRVPNGWYYIESTLNPRGSLYETNMSNNTGLRMVRLSGDRGNRRVTVVPWHGIEN
jgi:hypothetical protein